MTIAERELLAIALYESAARKHFGNTGLHSPPYADAHPIIRNQWRETADIVFREANA